MILDNTSIKLEQHVTCAINGCNKRGLFTHGICVKHYKREWKRKKLPPKIKIQTKDERFWNYVVKTKSCWVWVGTLVGREAHNGNGYGKFCKIFSHRYSYELLRGKIPKGMSIDHLCAIKSCVNPDHLEIVTLQENTRRSLKNRRCQKTGKLGKMISD